MIKLVMDRQDSRYTVICIESREQVKEGGLE